MAEKLRADTKIPTVSVKSEVVVEKREPTPWERSFVRDSCGRLIGRMMGRRIIHL